MLRKSPSFASAHLFCIFFCFAGSANSAQWHSIEHNANLYNRDICKNILTGLAFRQLENTTDWNMVAEVPFCWNRPFNCCFILLYSERSSNGHWAQSIASVKPRNTKRKKSRSKDAEDILKIQLWHTGHAGTTLHYTIIAPLHISYPNTTVRPLFESDYVLPSSLRKTKGHQETQNQWPAV